MIYISSIFKCFETVSGIKSGDSGVVIPNYVVDQFIVSVCHINKTTLYFLPTCGLQNPFAFR